MGKIVKNLNRPVAVGNLGRGLQTLPLLTVHKVGVLMLAPPPIMIVNCSASKKGWFGRPKSCNTLFQCTESKSVHKVWVLMLASSSIMIVMAKATKGWKGYLTQLKWPNWCWELHWDSKCPKSKWHWQNPKGIENSSMLISHGHSLHASRFAPQFSWLNEPVRGLLNCRSAGHRQSYSSHYVCWRSLMIFMAKTTKGLTGYDPFWGIP